MFSVVFIQKIDYAFIMQMITYCKTLFFRHILISRFPYVEKLLHFNFADFPVIFLVPQTNVIIEIPPVLNLARILQTKSW